MAGQEDPLQPVSGRLHEGSAVLRAEISGLQNTWSRREVGLTGIVWGGLG